MLNRLPLAARAFLLAMLALASACAPVMAPRASAPASPSRDIVTATILQMNDVYEIMPLGGSGLGGLARVAALRKQLLAENPNTFTVLAGDVLSPSALSSARAGTGGGALNGEQMVDLMNRAGLDYATFGNHEFDLREADFDKRMAESQFTWVSSNVFDDKGTPIPVSRTNVVLTAKNPAGRTLRIGLFGLTLDSNNAPYVSYKDPYETARAQVVALKNASDIVIALTHLAFAQDEQLAETVPGLALILGGHEHLNMTAHRGAGFTPVLKADSNAKSVYIHRLAYNTVTKRLDVDSGLVEITEAIPEDPEVAAAAAAWRDKGFAAFKSAGIDPEKTVTTLTGMLDGREAFIRSGSTNMTMMLNAAMIAAFPGAQVSIFNSGSIRIDDTLGPGPITQYDVLRVLPYPGDLFLTTMKGSVLARILTAGRDSSRRGAGAWLQAGGATQGSDGNWTIGGRAIDLNADYRVVINDYLLNGNERGLEWIKPADSGITVMPDAPVDFRVAVIRKLEKGS